jgi:hypothetical protein
MPTPVGRAAKTETSPAGVGERGVRQPVCLCWHGRVLTNKQTPRSSTNRDGVSIYGERDVAAGRAEQHRDTASLQAAVPSRGLKAGGVWLESSGYMYTSILSRVKEKELQCVCSLSMFAVKNNRGGCLWSGLVRCFKRWPRLRAW